MKKLNKNAIEWTVFAMSVVVITSVLAVLARDALSSKETAPDLRVAVGRTARSSTGFVVPIRVSNAGETTAEQAKVEVRLVREGAEVENAELTFAFVPAKSQRNGWVVFGRDPQCCNVEARAVSFEGP